MEHYAFIPKDFNDFTVQEGFIEQDEHGTVIYDTEEHARVASKGEEVFEYSYGVAH